MNAVFTAWGKTPERRDMLTTCSISGVMQSKTFLKKPAGEIYMQLEEDFKCRIISYRFFLSIGSNCVLVLELVSNTRLLSN